MTDVKPAPKKSVALSGVVAGNTALCSVGRSGNDLHYRGYDILDVAGVCEFEEIAHLLVHGSLPTRSELANYKAKLKSLRGLPRAVLNTLEQLPAAAHPMDVMRSGVSALGCVLPEGHDHNPPGARDIADRLMASLGSMLLYWHHYAHHGRRIEVETDDTSIGAHFLHLLHGKPPSASHERAMHTSLILYAEHEFNASTFTARSIAGTGADIYSAITGAIGALRGPKHGGANEVAFEVQKRYADPDEAEADIRRRIAAKEVVIGFGHPVYTIADPRNKVIKQVARQLSARGRQHAHVRDRRPHRGGDVRDQADVRQPRLVQRGLLSCDGRADGDVHAAVRDFAHLGLGGACHRATDRQQDHPPRGQLCRPGKPRLRPARGARPAAFVRARRIRRHDMPYLVASDLPHQTAGRRFRALLQRPGILRLPGTHNGMAALQAKAAGFEALYLSGAAMTASMGLPDLGIITVDEVAFFIRQVARAAGLPLLVDGDTGYGEALNVMHMVRVFEEAGAGAVHIEDQLLPKKCGHLNDKKLADAHDMAAKVAAAAKARRDLVVIARTDAAASEGLDGAVARAKLYMEAGADAIFPEALNTAEMFRAFAKRMPGVPLLANMTEFGKTPFFTASEFEQMGYRDGDLAGVLAARRQQGAGTALCRDRARRRNAQHDRADADPR